MCQKISLKKLQRFSPPENHCPEVTTFFILPSPPFYPPQPPEDRGEIEEYQAQIYERYERVRSDDIFEI